MIFSRIMDAKTTKGVWDILQEEFQGTTKVCTFRLQSLIRKFENDKINIIRPSNNIIVNQKNYH